MAAEVWRQASLMSMLNGMGLVLDAAQPFAAEFSREPASMRCCLTAKSATATSSRRTHWSLTS